MSIQETVRSFRMVLDRVSSDIFDHPELGFEEYRARRVIGDALVNGGFTVSGPVADMETAFIASHKGPLPGPHIAILAEYDALPGIGHGCGHNLIAAGAVTAALTAVENQPDHPGTISVIGTPAEEGGGGKIHLVDAGIFDVVDAAMMFHPSDRSIRNKHALAVTHAYVNFHGTAAHAAKTPWEGRSALAAMQVFMVALDSMRQFLKPTARLHYIITKGGDAPGMVPAHTQLKLGARDRTSAGVEELLRRVTLAAEGAALATETSVELEVDPLQYSDRINNMTMAAHFAATFEEHGVSMPEGQPDEPSGSSDIGNVSHVVPIIHPCVNITKKPTPGHSEAFKAAAKSGFAADQTQIAAEAMARLTLDLLDPSTGLLEEARAEFKEATSRSGQEPGTHQG